MIVETPLDDLRGVQRSRNRGGESLEEQAARGELGRGEIENARAWMETPT